MLELQHLHHHVPVTALAFSADDDYIFAGEGHFLCVYDVKPQHRLARLEVFEQQAIQGIIVEDSAQSRLIVWGGHLVRSIECRQNRCSGVVLEPGPVCKATDWILDASFSPQADGGKQDLVAFVTTHNALTISSTEALTNGGSRTSDPELKPLISGTNSLLYCAHIQCQTPSHCLIVSGTAFGDVIVWSAFLSHNATGDMTTSTQTHYTFSAHEGSVFGVQLSPVSTGHQHDYVGACERLLATCSDDRMIKVWDLSTLPSRDDEARPVRGTGYRSITATPAESAPRCIAKTLGHASRIWHIRFLPPTNFHQQRLMSFGEDATALSWHLTLLPISPGHTAHDPTH
ncbi:WD repeat-containing protein 6, partial [Teratosphaeriaceae sp. CCFEE 6253]